jgi:hypothetical protein
MEVERRRWLERLATACEQVLANADGPDRSRAHDAALLDGVEALLAKIRAELSTGNHVPQ